MNLKGNCGRLALLALVLLLLLFALVWASYAEKENNNKPSDRAMVFVIEGGGFYE